MEIPPIIQSYLQEYDLAKLDPKRDADLLIQRVLEFGDWEEVRWLIRTYGVARIRQFLRRRGERWLRPVTFNYWRKLFRLRKWEHSPFPTSKGELWHF